MLLEGKVAVVTGGANGLGKGVAERLAGEGARVVVGDLESGPGQEVAEAIGGLFIECDVSDPAASEALVEKAVSEYGGLDIAFLNAGIATGCEMADQFDLEKYRRAMGANLDGVVFGINSAVQAMKERGGGRIVATASLAGLAPVPGDPIYAANKHAVVGLVRSLGPLLISQGIHLNAVCPGFTETRIIEPFREGIEGQKIPIIPVPTVVDAVVELIEDDVSGVCRMVQAGMEAQDFRFRRVPGPR